MPQDRKRHRLDILEVDDGTPVEKRAGLPPQQQRLTSPRASTPPNPLPHELGRLFAGRTRRTHQARGILDDVVGRRHVAHHSVQLLDLIAARHRVDPRLLRPGCHRENPPLFLGGRILDHDVEHEAIELGLRQRICAFLLDRILGGENEQRTVQGVTDAADRDLVFLHGLEQGGLSLGRRPVDLVGQENVREDRAVNEANHPLAGRPVFLNHLRAQDVGRHQIGRELNTVEFQVYGLRELLDQVAAGEKGNQNLAHHTSLADDGLRELAFEPHRDLGHAVD